MSGECAWEKAVSFSCFPLQYSMFNAVLDQLQKIPKAHGTALVPVLVGGDQTTTSVATGDNEYYPLYISIGNVHNNVRRAHRDAVEVIAFLAVSKSQ
jgi:Plavaka transposase